MCICGYILVKYSLTAANSVQRCAGKELGGIYLGQVPANLVDANLATVLIFVYYLSFQISRTPTRRMLVKAIASSATLNIWIMIKSVVSLSKYAEGI